MNTEDHKRVVRAINETKPDDKAALVCIMKEDGSIFLCTGGTLAKQAELLLHTANYYASVVDSSKGGRE